LTEQRHEQVKICHVYSSNDSLHTSS